MPGTATHQEITKAFRRELLQHHPDKNLNSREECIQRSMSIVEAYKVLSSKEMRLGYDKHLERSGSKEEGHL